MLQAQRQVQSSLLCCYQSHVLLGLHNRAIFAAACSVFAVLNGTYFAPIICNPFGSARISGLLGDLAMAQLTQFTHVHSTSYQLMSCSVVFMHLCSNSIQYEKLETDLNTSPHPPCLLQLCGSSRSSVVGAAWSYECHPQ